MSDCAADTRRAYDELAPFYDDFTRHHDYDAWTAELERLALDSGLTGHRLLDVGCGTGKSFLPFLARGWSVAACDISPAMVAIAAAKAPAVPLTVHDMRSLPTLGSFDLVACIDDGLNYLTDLSDVEAALAGMRRNLSRGGLVLFDVNTLATYRGFFASCAVSSDEDCMLVWQGMAAEDFGAGECAPATVTAFARRDDQSWRRSESQHLQRHHPPALIQEALRRAGLETVAVYGQGLDGRPTRTLDEARHTKAVFVARERR
jgi:ubiquinone/menaquinone biosynthesis C-methylase UbiE